MFVEINNIMTLNRVAKCIKIKAKDIKYQTISNFWNGKEEQE